MAKDNIVAFDVPEGEIEDVIATLRNMGAMVDAAAATALPKIGREILVRIKRNGPRSAAHRGPAKKPRVRPDRWRSEVVHAIDTVTVSPLRRDLATNSPYIMVGPGRGDNSPSFYLKFFEYGRAGDKYEGRPFIRPARREVMQDVAPKILVDECNQQLRKGMASK